MIAVYGFPFQVIELWRKNSFVKYVFHLNVEVVRRFEVDSSIENLGSSRSDE